MKRSYFLACKKTIRKASFYMSNFPMNYQRQPLRKLLSKKFFQKIQKCSRSLELRQNHGNPSLKELIFSGFPRFQSATLKIELFRNFQCNHVPKIVQMTASMLLNV